MCQEVGLDRHPGAFSLPDGLAQAQGVPVDDDGGQEVEPRHAVVPAFAGAVADFALASDAKRVLQGVMGFPFVQPDMARRRLCCKPDVGVSEIRTTAVLASCFCAGQTVL